MCYCGKADVGRISRSISSNRAGYSPRSSDQDATGDAFDVLYYIARKRLAAGRLTVVDATSVKAEDRRPLVALAREFHVLPVAIVFDLPAKLCQARPGPTGPSVPRWCVSRPGCSTDRCAGSSGKAFAR
jgi:predicted kinase